MDPAQGIPFLDVRNECLCQTLRLIVQNWALLLLMELSFFLLIVLFEYKVPWLHWFHSVAFSFALFKCKRFILLSAVLYKLGLLRGNDIWKVMSCLELVTSFKRRVESFLLAFHYIQCRVLNLVVAAVDVVSEHFGHAFSLQELKSFFEIAGVRTFHIGQTHGQVVLLSLRFQKLLLTVFTLEHGHIHLLFPCWVAFNQNDAIAGKFDLAKLLIVKVQQLCFLFLAYLVKFAALIEFWLVLLVPFDSLGYFDWTTIALDLFEKLFFVRDQMSGDLVAQV